MANKRHAGPDTDHHLPIVEVIGLTGMTGAEVRDYLSARGVEYSLSAVRAWTRGLYRPPPEALEELWRIVRAVMDYSEPMPPEAPESARRRAAVTWDMLGWWNERHPDPALVELEQAEAEERAAAERGEGEDR